RVFTKPCFMPIMTGVDRHQVSFSSLEDKIAVDNELRFIDAFVDKLDLKQLGVQSLTAMDKKKEGRASFSDALFLKLYLYAYLNIILPYALVHMMNIAKGIHFYY